MSGARTSRNVRLAGLLAALLVGGPGLAQNRPAGVHVAADEQALWLVRLDQHRSAVLRRGVNEAFRPLPPLNAAIREAVADAHTLYAFTRTGELWSLTTEKWSPELNLPGAELPIDMVVWQNALLALVRSPEAGALARLVQGTRPSESQPFDCGGSPLCLVRYDARGWAGLAACPPDVPVPDSGRRPRIGVLNDTPAVFWYDGRTVRQARLDVAAGAWIPGPPGPEVDQVADFWITSAGRVPILVVALPGSQGQVLRAWRLLGDPASAEWREARLQLSALPAGVDPARYASAGGFNQHVALLVIDEPGNAYIQFARPDATPAEASVTVREAFGRRPGPLADAEWFQTATVLIVFGIVLGLFIFRRGALVKVLELPADMGLALAFQRLAGFLIDFAPFLFVFSAVLGVGWQQGLSQLLGWALGSGGTTAHAPEGRTLLWWAAATASYTVYTLVIELVSRRTIGKVLLGTSVASENGQPATVVQVLIRNAFRFVELQPPLLWGLGLLVLISRNRQRVGDVFARTLVVRRVSGRRPPREPT